MVLKYAVSYVPSWGDSDPNSLSSSALTPLHCTALHCTAMHCTALHYTAMHCTTLHCNALHCTALNCSALYWSVEPGQYAPAGDVIRSGIKTDHPPATVPQHCTALHSTALHCTASYKLQQYCSLVHYTALYCSALHCSVLSGDWNDQPRRRDWQQNGWMARNDRFNNLSS